MYKDLMGLRKNAHRNGFVVSFTKKRPEGEQGVFGLQAKLILLVVATIGRLKYVRDELVSPVVTTWLWVVIVPLLVVDGDPHFWWIPVVHIVRTSVVLVTPVVLGVRNVRVVIETAKVL